MTIAISPEHGYVILAASGTFLLNVWQMMKIGGKRKELGIAVSLLGLWSIISGYTKLGRFFLNWPKFCQLAFITTFNFKWSF